MGRAALPPVDAGRLALINLTHQEDASWVRQRKLNE
jgi:hypothetical protein